MRLDDHHMTVDGESIKVTMDDFVLALQEVKSALGVSIDELQMCRPNGMVDCGHYHN